MTVTFCQVRPGADDVTEIWAATRRKEGTLVGRAGRARPRRRGPPSLAGGLLPCHRPAGPRTIPNRWPGWSNPAVALELAKAGVAGWRITVRDEGSAEAVLDAVARTGAAFLRTGRSRVRRAVEIAAFPAVRRPGLGLRRYRRRGAGGRRRWCHRPAAARLGSESQSASSATDWPPDGSSSGPPSRSASTSRRSEPPLDADLFTGYLNQVDGSGAARPRYDWAPGKPADPPVPAGPAVAAMGRPGLDWRLGRLAASMNVEPDLQRILTRSLAGTATVPRRQSSGSSSPAVTRSKPSPPWPTSSAGAATVTTVTYVVNRNINYTNQCYFRCGFCAFSKGPSRSTCAATPTC